MRTHNGGTGSGRPEERHLAPDVATAANILAHARLIDEMGAFRSTESVDSPGLTGAADQFQR